MAEQRPNDELTALAVYVVNAYVPTVMSTRQRPDLVEAPKHFFSQLERQRRHLPGDALDTVQRSIFRNSYIGYIGIASRTRKRCYLPCLVKKAEGQAGGSAAQNQLRSCNAPVINLDAQTYMELM